MSQSQIPMRKNKKLAINIALASKSEADQDLGSSKEEKKMSESSSSERRIRDVSQKLSSKAQEIDDDHSSVRDGIMREVDVGTGLSGALNRLRDQGTFKGEKSKVASSVRDNVGEDRFRDMFKDIRIDRVDECGRVLNMKEAHRFFSHGFYGVKPGKKKQEKRRKKKLHEDNSKQMETSDRAVARMREVHAQLNSPYIVL